MSTLKSSAEDLTLNADGSGNDIKFQSNAVEKGSLSDAGLLTTSGGASLDGAVTINDTGADVDFRVEGDNKANALFVQGSNSYVGIGSGTPVRPLTIDTQTGTTSLGGTAEVIKIAGSDADETYCGIGFHYDNSDGQTHSPAFMGYQSKDFSGSTNGDLVFATRSGTSDDAPTESMRITADGRGLSQFTARAWANYNHYGAAIRDSHGISSVTDGGLGRATYNFTANFANADYAAFASSSGQMNGSATSSFKNLDENSPAVYTYAVGSVKTACYDGSLGSYVDMDWICLIAFGE